MENAPETNIKINKKINKKSIQFILNKSEELEKDYLLVSFLCILYIVEQLSDHVKNNYSDIEAKNILIKCLDKAEKIRPSFDSIDYNKLAQFCKRLFLAADKNDRNEKITKKTLQMFFTSHIFYEILNHFKELDSDEKKYYLYAKYKIIYLKKCFDDNIKPKPGTPRNEKESISDEDDYREEQFSNKCQPIDNSDKNIYLDENSIDSPDNKKKEDTVDFSLSLKHAQYAVNALMFEDLDTAKTQLKLSLSYLQK